MDASTLRDSATDAIKFWERGRVLYNLALAAVVVLHFVAGYPASKAVLSLDFGLGLFLLAVAANIAYCAAYLADISPKPPASANCGNDTAGFSSPSAPPSPPSSPTSSPWGCSTRVGSK